MESSKIEAKSPGVEKLRTINYGGEPLYRASDADAEFRRLASPLAQAAPDLRRFLELAIARFKEADEERYAALMEFRKKSEKGKREGDWYGFNFYAGMDAGCNWASLMFNRVWRELDTLLKHLPERSAVETSSPLAAEIASENLQLRLALNKVCESWVNGRRVLDGISKTEADEMRRLLGKNRCPYCQETNCAGPEECASNSRRAQEKNHD